MTKAIALYERELKMNPDLSHTAFCIKFGLDDGFRTSMCVFMKDPQLLDGGCGSGKNQATELVQKSETDTWNLDITARYSEAELFAKVGKITLLHTLAKEEFGGRMGSGWKTWLSRKITAPCKAIYAKRDEESNDKSVAGIDL